MVKFCIPKLPYKKKLRVKNCKYIDKKGKLVIWNGKILKCEHGRQELRCRDCGGSSFCQHDIMKSHCKDCGGSALCTHGLQKAQCKPCGGSAFCTHEIRKATCKDCGGSAFCKHEIQKTTCKECHPEKYAKNLERIRRHYYKKRGYKPGDITIKKFEHEMITFLLNTFPDAELILGKSIGKDCTENKTHRFPDVRMFWKHFQIVFECDENAHRGKAYECDWRRMNEISISVMSPVWFIRWNPNGTETLKTLEQTAKQIMRKTEITWEYNRQFNATYLGYSEKDMQRQKERKKSAFN